MDSHLGKRPSFYHLLVIGNAAEVTPSSGVLQPGVNLFLHDPAVDKTNLWHHDLQSADVYHFNFAVTRHQFSSPRSDVVDIDASTISQAADICLHPFANVGGLNKAELFEHEVHRHCFQEDIVMRQSLQ